jgi:hypothetical protein
MPEATNTDTTTCEEKWRHMARVLAHLGQQREQALSEAPVGPTDVLTELSALMDLHLTLSRLDHQAQRRAFAERLHLKNHQTMATPIPP